VPAPPLELSDTCSQNGRPIAARRQPTTTLRARWSPAYGLGVEPHPSPRKALAFDVKGRSRVGLVFVGLFLLPRGSACWRNTRGHGDHDGQGHRRRLRSSCR